MAELAGGRAQLSRKLRSVLDALPEAVAITDAAGRLAFANAAALERMGCATLEEALARGTGALLERFAITTENGSPLSAKELPGRRLLRGKPAEPLLLRLAERGSGQVRWGLLKASALPSEQGPPLILNVLEDVTETKEQELRERFLSLATEALNASLDLAETLQRVASLAVPDLADWCLVELLEHGRIRQVAVAHEDPAQAALVRGLRRRYVPTLEDAHGVGAVLRSGRAEFYPSIPDELLAAAVDDEAQLRMVRELQLRSAIIAPMRGRRGVEGAITFVAAERVGAYDERDLAFARDFAARAASAVENARLHGETALVAETLRRSLVPAAPPEVAGWRTAALYRPGADQIGGDFFELMPTERGFTVVLGDVTGKGVEAATLAARARHSASAAAALGLAPAAILELLNSILLRTAEVSLVTAVVGRVAEAVGGATLALSSAGHPLPLRHRAGRAPEPLGRPGVLLGFDPHGRWPQPRLQLRPGDTIVFYTDGVTEALGRRGRFSEERLRSLLAECPADPDAIVLAIDSALQRFGQGEERRDDVALLAVQLLD
jgi:hypothetical protein